MATVPRYASTQAGIIAGAVSQTTATLAGIGGMFLEDEINRQYRNAQVQAIKAFDGFQLGLLDDNDFPTYNERFTTFAEDTHRSITEGMSMPRAKQEFEAWWAEQEGNYKLSVAEKARQMQVKTSAAETLARVDFHVQQGRPEMVREELTSPAALRLFDPVVLQDTLKQKEYEAHYRAIWKQLAVDQDPNAALLQLTEYNERVEEVLGPDGVEDLRNRVIAVKQVRDALEQERSAAAAKEALDGQKSLWSEGRYAEMDPSAAGLSGDGKVWVANQRNAWQQQEQTKAEAERAQAAARGQNNLYRLSLARARKGFAVPPAVLGKLPDAERKTVERAAADLETQKRTERQAQLYNEYRALAEGPGWESLSTTRVRGMIDVGDLDPQQGQKIIDILLPKIEANAEDLYAAKLTSLDVDIQNIRAVTQNAILTDEGEGPAARQIDDLIAQISGDSSIEEGDRTQRVKDLNGLRDDLTKDVEERAHDAEWDFLSANFDNETLDRPMISRMTYLSSQEKESWRDRLRKKEEAEQAASKDVFKENDERLTAYAREFMRDGRYDLTRDFIEFHVGPDEKGNPRISSDRAKDLLKELDSGMAGLVSGADDVLDRARAEGAITETQAEVYKQQLRDLVYAATEGGRAVTDPTSFTKTADAWVQPHIQAKLQRDKEAEIQAAIKASEQTRTPKQQLLVDQYGDAYEKAMKGVYEPEIKRERRDLKAKFGNAEALMHLIYEGLLPGVCEDGVPTAGGEWSEALVAYRDAYEDLFVKEARIDEDRVETWFNRQTNDGRLQFRVDEREDRVFEIRPKYNENRDGLMEEFWLLDSQKFRETGEEEWMHVADLRGALR